MTSVEIVDRSDLIGKIHAALDLRPRETAIVTVDMHRGHLDMDVATMPAKSEDASRIIAASAEVLALARSHAMPVIHVVLVHRKIPGFGSEAMAQPFWRAVATVRDADNRLTPGRASTVTEHNIEGSRGTEIIPELYADEDYVIDNKKRLDCFFGTDLRTLLDTLGVTNVCLMGINTNTCVLNTAFSAFNFDYGVVVLKDCVGSMYGDDLHELGLQNVARCLGWVMSNDEFRDKIEAGALRND